jgi:RNA polymerase sigma-70 factor (ECF subfamily)
MAAGELSGSSKGMLEARLKGLAPLAAQGDPDAFGEIYGLLGRRVLGLCRHLLGSLESAEDATSEVFLKVHRAMRGEGGTYNPEMAFVPWLMSVAGNHCIDLLRRRKLEGRIFAVPAAAEDAGPRFEARSEAPSVEDALVASAERGAVRAAMAALPDHYRVPLTLRYFSDQSYDQIAAAMGLTRNHVATLIFRGKKELRSALAQKATAAGKGKA